MKRHSSFIALVLFFGCCGFTPTWAQPLLLGLGLSASPTRLDTVITDGDTIHVIASYTVPPDIRIEGVALGSAQLQQVQVNFYTAFPPSGSPESFDVIVSSADVSIDSLAHPPVLRFAVPLPVTNNPNTASLQINLAIYGRDTTDRIQVSERRASYIAVSSVAPLDNPVDSLHSRYLRFVDFQTRPPTLFSPQRRSVLGRQFAVRYRQPEDAWPGTLALSIDNMDTAAHDNHRLFLRNRTAGSLKTLNLNSNVLFNSLDMDSSSGPNALRHAAYYTFRISYQDINFNPPAFSEVDSVQADLRTEPPVIIFPDSGRSVPRRFTVQYNQPESAKRGTVLLVFTNVDTNSTEPSHSLFLRDLSAGSNKLLPLDALALYDSTRMDSISGPQSLTNGANYEMELSYQDNLGNDVEFATVTPVHLDVQTEAPLLFEPRAGSSTTDSTVRVIYQLLEPADTVWLSFVEDTVSSVHDTLSPHTLRLVSTLNGPGVVSFFLDGRNIGIGPYVAESNRGANDRLVTQCVYTVTLTYSDLTGNLPRSVSNNSYVWPRDGVTLPPRILEPTSLTSFPPAFRLVFSLPEAALPGSVHLRIGGDPTQDHGSPHVIYLRNTVPGLNTLIMAGHALSQGQSVDSVTGAGTPAENNTLVGGVFCFFLLIYQDSSANPAANSGLPVTATFDDRTDPILFLVPHAGDTLDRTNIEIQFEQPERALPSSLHLIFERFAGGDDPYRHVLRLHDEERGAKSITIHASALSTTPGADTLSGGDALILRAVYRLSMEYQDTLSNDRTVSFVDSLAYPSGTVVVAEGTDLGDGQVVPGNFRKVAFRLSLRTLSGEGVLRQLRFWPDGNMDASDLDVTKVHLWSSVDTVLSDAQDSILANLSSWAGGEIIFHSFSTNLQEAENNYFVTLGFYSAANAAHRVRLQLISPASIDCAGDPVLATHWPLGERDVALGVSLTEFGADQDTAFGALRIWWTVASETDNQGFTLLRRDDNGTQFQAIASWRDHPELVGRGTSPTAVRYQFADRGLVPGARYVYHLSAESFTGDGVDFDAEAVGSPRLPPNDFILGNAYPNPFNQTVSIPFVVPYTAKVEITIYNLLGQKVRLIARGLLVPAEYRAGWDGRDEAGMSVPSGLYLVRMEAGGSFDKTHKLFLLR